MSLNNFEKDFEMKPKNIRVFNTLDKDSSIKADEMHNNFVRSGVDFASGVPCGVLRHVIRNFANDSRIVHLPTNRESESVGLAAGAYLGGKIPIVYMQNSGLFAASNDIASLLIPYKIPIFFVISYRGCPGEDAVQHLVTGQATEILLHSFGLHFVVFEKNEIGPLLNTRFKKMDEIKLPVFLLLKRWWHK